MTGGTLRRALLCGAILTTWAAQASAADAIAWRTDWRDAWSEAQEQQRPLLVFVTRDPCKFCAKMKQATYIDTRIVERIEEGFVPVVVDATAEEKFAHDLKVTAYPTTVLISPDSKILDRIKGFVEPKDFDARLADAERRLESVARRQASPTDEPVVTK